MEFAGYDVRHTWGVGSHNGSQAEALFPEAMRWLWRDWPKPIEALPPGNPVLKTILQPGEEWQVAATCASVAQLAVDPQGQVFYPTRSVPAIATIPANANTPCQPSATAALTFTADGKLYLARPAGGLRVMDHGVPRRSSQLLAPELGIINFTVRSNGDIYALARAGSGGDELWLVRPGRQPLRLQAGLKSATALAFSPDGLWLFVAGASRAGLSYRVRSDGMLDAPAPFYDFYVPAWSDETGATTIAMDHTGLAYVATAMGVQVFDRNGRVAAILPLPGNVAATALCFGGPDFNTLYVAGGGHIYRRKLRASGAPSWAAPATLPPWGAG